MTTSDIGRNLKSMHPGHYDDIDDARLGRAMKAKHPGFFDHIAEPDEIEAGNSSGRLNAKSISSGTCDMDKGTVPETPKTLALQLGQLQGGIRRVVFIARGSKVKVNPADYGARKLLLPPGEFIYDPKAIKPKEIIAAVKNHELSEILGAADGGYGTVDKSELRGPVQAVVARDEDGETVNSALTDQEHEGAAIAQAGKLTPDGGAVSLEDPGREISHRMADSPNPSEQAGPLPVQKRKGGRWAKPGPITIPHHQ